MMGNTIPAGKAKGDKEMTKAEKKEMRELIAEIVKDVLKDMKDKGELGTKIIERHIIESSGDGGGCRY